MSETETELFFVYVLRGKNTHKVILGLGDRLKMKRGENHEMDAKNLFFGFFIDLIYLLQTSKLFSQVNGIVSMAYCMCVCVCVCVRRKISNDDNDDDLFEWIWDVELFLALSLSLSLRV